MGAMTTAKKATAKKATAKKATAKKAPARKYTDWKPVIARAREIVEGYETRVTLRQLFYRLVSEGLIPNTLKSYDYLSDRTAIARRAGTFPDLFDRGRWIHRPAFSDDVDDAIDGMLDGFRLDRTIGQDVSVYLAVEKAGLVELVSGWYEEQGIPVLALGGYASQSYVDQVAREVRRQGRPAVLLYAGDWDPEGEDIDRDFEARTGCWDKVVRVALTVEQVIEHGLPIAVGKEKSSRAATFREKYGRLAQVELDALPPDVLRRLFDEALAEWWDAAASDRVMADERDAYADLTRIVAR